MAVISGSKSVGTCESCPKENVEITLCSKIWMCDECMAKEIAIAMEHQTPEKQEERLRAHKNVEAVYLDQVKKENAALRISSDIFNAKIKSISELKTAIDADAEIENKNFALARVLNERFQHLNHLLHDKYAEIAEHENEQRAIQTFYNELSKKLRAEEREKIKLSDLNYKPIEQPVKIKKEIKPKKYDKTGIAAASLKSGIAEQIIQMVCVARDITPEAAVMILQEQGVGKKVNGN